VLCDARNPYLLNGRTEIQLPAQQADDDDQTNPGKAAVAAWFPFFAHEGSMYQIAPRRKVSAHPSCLAAAWQGAHNAGFRLAEPDNQWLSQG
jgi:hypothetical protein